MVYRVYVQKRPEFAQDAKVLLHDIRTLLEIKSVEDVRIVNRYDCEGVEQKTFDDACRTVFSEPQVDEYSFDFDYEATGTYTLAVEALPGQFDQRSDSACQCIRFIDPAANPRIKYAKLYQFTGNVSEVEKKAIQTYLINPVENRSASFAQPECLEERFDIPTEVEIIEGFCAFSESEMEAFIADRGLAMDAADIACIQQYFKAEGRNPSVTEIKVIDTYWSDHCRHTTFNTIIDAVTFEDNEVQQAWEHYLDVRDELQRTKPTTLMDVGTIAAKYLRSKGLMTALDESEEINACSIKVDVEIDGQVEPWIIMFKNETHNHPTEIEPFGGAATCIGGAIRDPLSGRSYVYGAMRLTGAADPTVRMQDTIPGKLPQRTIVTKAAAGYSSYGNQIGLATGLVDEVYHPGYAAKRMEVGAVIAGAPASVIRRERPAAGDVVVYLGGSTGRDGIGGATGSSKAHDSHSVETCGAEVQKGNAPEERKLQRLFRNPEAARLIKRCNDFGAGGVSVAIGELADGLHIDLNTVPKKYEGLDGTELAISESQERMAVVVAEQDAKRFLELAASENLQACIVAQVTEEPRLVMEWNGKTIVDISRAFLDTNGAAKHIEISCKANEEACAPKSTPMGSMNESFADAFKAMLGDLNCCSRRDLSERFDSTIGAGGVLMPFGGMNQLTPVQAMVQKVSLEHGDTTTCTLMSWGFNPYLSERSPYRGAYSAVVESVAKLIATGAPYADIYLSFQEYFEKLGRNEVSWGKPLSALLGAFEAQVGLGVAAIGGKDSMSGTFENIHVPPTLISFAVNHAHIDDIVSNECKDIDHQLIWIRPNTCDNGLVDAQSFIDACSVVHALLDSGKAISCYTPTMGGAANAVYKMCLGNVIGFDFSTDLSVGELFAYQAGTFVLELADNIMLDDVADYIHESSPVQDSAGISVVLLGKTTEQNFTYGDESIAFGDALEIFEGKLEDVYGCDVADAMDPKTYEYKVNSWPTARLKMAKPRVLIPVFPGTNCEYDSARAIERAGADADIFVIKNLDTNAILRSLDDFRTHIDTSQMIFIPGGFSGGDEPDGSAKFITAFFRNEQIADGVENLLYSRDGLMCGICNGFQALIKLGLVPYGHIVETTDQDPTLTFNTIARHASKIVRTRVVSNMSPWLRFAEVGGVYQAPVSHGEGRFVAPREVIEQLIEHGQIATQYVDFAGCATYDVQDNPNGSFDAIEGITSPDGRVFGKMGHAERVGRGLYKNVPGNYDLRMFESAVAYFK